MAEPQVIRPSYRGRVTFDHTRSHDGTDYFRSRRQRPHILRVAHALDEYAFQPKTPKKRPGILRAKKLITGSDHAKRLIRLISSPSTTQEGVTGLTPAQSPTTTTSPTVIQRRASEGFLEPGSVSPLDQPADSMTRAGSPRGSIVSAPPLHPRHAAALMDSAASAHTSSSIDSSMVIDGIKPVATGNGVSVFITMAEPMIFLSGFENQDPSTRSTAMLRGNLVLRVTKSAKIKGISMKFKGHAETDWPEGIPPKRAEFSDKFQVIDHHFMFYSCNMGNSEHHGAHTYIPASAASGGAENDTALVANGFEQFRKSGVFESIAGAREGRRLSLQNNHVKSLGRGEVAPNPSHKGYRTFTPGEYYYNFELPIDSRYPESIDVDLGRVKYELEAMVERAGAFRANLSGSKPVQLVRAPSGESLESVEPIAISRDWEDQLHYDIVISGKSFPLGTKVPIAFKLTPLAKVKCHRIKVFITENIQYFTKDKKVHRMEPTRKLLLFEKRSDSHSNSTFPGSTLKIVSGGGVKYDDRERAARGEENVEANPENMLGDLEADSAIIGPTELEMNVQLPSCFHMADGKDKKQDKIHFDTTYSNIQVNHWIKIVMRLSKTDPENPGKRRHFEISIDSPLNILSCRSTQANTALPSYTPRDTTVVPEDQPTCGCPHAPTPNSARRRNLSGTTLNTSSSNNHSPRATPSSSQADLSSTVLPPPPAAHLAGTPTSSTESLSSSATEPQPAAQPDNRYSQARDTNRPIHLLRQPSFNPPAFDDIDAPPPLVTPPPQYETQFGSGGGESGLADYFQRLADEIDDSDDGQQWASRLEIPLTPGGRVNRSMDEVRGWQHLAPVTRS